MDLLLLLIILSSIISYEIYKEKYYKSWEFNELKLELEDYIEESNDLNGYINELTDVYKDIGKNNYGVATMKYDNKHNYKLSTHNKTEKSQFIYDCSPTVLSNAKNQPFKYLCKYFNIDESEESLEKFEDVLNSFMSVKEGKIILRKKLNTIEKICKNDLPFMIKST